MGSAYVDNSAIIQVLGNLYNNPKLLDLTEKYNITEDDFPDRFHKIIFGSIYKIYELGANKINLKNILDFLSSRPKNLAIFEKEKGEEWLLSVSENAQSASFDYYYNRLKKMTLLRAYDNCGVDVSDIYDPDNILDSKKKQNQEDFLDNSSLSNLAEIIDNKIEEIKMKYVSELDTDAVQAGEGINNLLDRLKEQPDVGIPLYGSLVNTVTRGARLKKFYLRSAPTGCGKAIPNDVFIPTPDGLKRVKDIQKGDYLFDADGEPTKVLNIFPQEEMKKICCVSLSDGREAKCCEEHLWEYRINNNFNYEVNDTSYIKKLLDENKKIEIRFNKEVEYKEKEYEIPPYVLGTLVKNRGINIYENKIEYLLSDTTIIENILHYYNRELKWEKLEDNNIYKLYIPISESNEYLIKCIKNKKIPENYLEGSLKQRKFLLKGLMDVGGISKLETNKFYYPTDIEGIENLIRSLGLMPSKEEGLILFPLDFRKELNLPRFNNHVVITNITITDLKAEMTCFQVDNKNHLFLMNDYIVTHNTRSMIADACYISCGAYYDEDYGWIKTGYKEPTLFISTEQELEEVQTMILAFISGVNEDIILDSRYKGDEEERVRQAAKIVSDAPLFIEELPDFSLQDVENVIKKNIREHDVSYIFHDYIHTSLKILEEITRRSGGVRLREDNVLFMLSTRLKDICNKYGVFMMSATQLNGDYVDSKTPDQNLLRGKIFALIYLIPCTNGGHIFRVANGGT